MARVTYFTPDGVSKVVDLRGGQSIMEGAVQHGIQGILAECGGSCMCATCHVYIIGGPVERLADMQSGEDAMLNESAAERKPNSRLSCQIKMSDDLDGLVVQVAENAE